MPQYDFYCKQCERYYTFFLRMTDSRPTVCEVCGGNLQRVWGVPSVHYQDSGFTKYGGRNGAGEPIIERRD